MSSIDTPLWVELSGSSLDTKQVLGWPYLDVKHPDLNQLLDLVRSFLDSPTEFFSTKIKGMSLSIHLRYFEPLKVYRGIIIPSDFPSLDALMKNILNQWELNTDKFTKWVQYFFQLRLQQKHHQLFQVEPNYTVRLPPIFVLNQEQIQGQLLHKLRSRITDITDLTRELLFDTLDSELSDKYIQLIDAINSERELIILHLINVYLNMNDMICYDEYLHLNTLMSKISPHLSTVVLYNFIFLRLKQGKILEDKLLSHLTDHLNYHEGMLRILILRILILVAKQADDIPLQEQYNRQLLQYAPVDSWSKNLDLINAQLGLATCSVGRGDYFRAMTFYSFARQVLSINQVDPLQEEMETEYRRISVLAASQHLQAGLYQMNHGDTDRNTRLILIEGIQMALSHYLRFYKEETSMIAILPPLLRSASKTLYIHQDKFNQLFPAPLEYDNFTKLVEALDSDNSGNQLSMMQEFMEALSFKDQKMVEKISVFYRDGRHIADYALYGPTFKQLSPDSNQSLFSSAMSAVSMIVSEATESEDDVDEISIGSKTVIYDQGNHLTFCLIANASSSNLKQILLQVRKAVEKEYSSFLKNWSGDHSIFDDLVGHLQPLAFFSINYQNNNDNIKL